MYQSLNCDLGHKQASIPSLPLRKRLRVPATWQKVLTHRLTSRHEGGPPLYSNTPPSVECVSHASSGCQRPPAKAQGSASIVPRMREISWRPHTFSVESHGSRRRLATRLERWSRERFMLSLAAHTFDFYCTSNGTAVSCLYSPLSPAKHPELTWRCPAILLCPGHEQQQQIHGRGADQAV